MSESCNHDCNHCSASCDSRDKAPQSMLAPLNAKSSVKKVIGIVSGKGGVGKSLVTSLLAAGMQRKGYRVAVLDADITGPSIPKAFGVQERATGNGEEMAPVVSKKGVKIMSTNLLLEDDTDPVVWRGPILAGVVKQFWSDVVWGEIDYMFVDMPPGTGDVPLTVYQSLPIDGIIIVTSPQELVSMIVAKAVKMAQMMRIPVLGVVENMSYFQCPDCGKQLHVFGESHLSKVALEYGLPVLGQIPIDPTIAQHCDAGNIEELDADWLDYALKVIEQ